VNTADRPTRPGDLFGDDEVDELFEDRLEDVPNRWEARQQVGRVRQRAGRGGRDQSDRHGQRQPGEEAVAACHER